MVRRVRLPDGLAAAGAGLLAAVFSGACCVLVGAVLTSQVLVGGVSADWALPALATMLGVLGSLGPVGFYNETAQGAIGLGIETTALPWVAVAIAPMIVVAHLFRHRLTGSVVGPIGFALGYGIGAGVGVGLGSMWAVGVEPGIDLPVSPDLVAGRSAVLALLTVVVLGAGRWFEPVLAYLRPVVLGALTMGAAIAALWLVGLTITLFSAPVEAREGVATSGSVVGANLGAAAIFDAIGSETSLTVRSGLTGSIRDHTLAGVTALPEAGIVLIGNAVILAAIVVALLVSSRRRPVELPAVWLVLGVALGLAGAGAGLAALVDGGIDLVILPDDGRDVSFSEVRLALTPSSVFTQLGGRAVLVGLPVLWLGRRAGDAPRIEAEPIT